ncbi:LptF/LptG family permease [Truepera radiovictrix]|uniref:Permease YjgP/YjgQ family protein n=1 Tax=Truepera radiovictrix (strain DSM 17093 / CIP 108686 / LMG 22925 / RQ-24) TaxID=649638 RepID=D7CVA8_TRURR|nr:LptF/LptG family permease [Truepera radiovictrix]ADI14136.1 permease YjgP/YjgQ family protein [Truepera radiovictrix DSM 17093]WMT57303.1 LptF/LptG family permease [Truepera radiovictrix]
MRLDRYLLRECLPALLFSLLLYSGLAVTSANFPRLQWIIGTPLWGMLGWLALQLPTAIVQTLPIALLLAVLLTFGRLAAANELLAVQAGGVALRRLSAPMLALGLLAAGCALAMNQWVLPRANVRVGALWWELTSGGSGLFRLERQSIPLGEFSLSFAATDRRTDDLFGVRLEAWRGRQLSVVLAERARFVEGGLELYGYQNAVLDVGSLRDGAGTPEAQLQALVRLHNRAPSPDAPLRITFAEDVDELITRFSGGGFEDTRSVTRTLRDANDPSLSAAERRAAAVLFHRKLAEPFANLTLLAVALPLAVLHARSRSVAFGLSLAVTLAWYLLLTLGQLLAQAGVLPVWLGLWFGNALLLLLGLYLLYARTNLR